MVGKMKLTAFERILGSGGSLGILYKCHNGVLMLFMVYNCVDDGIAHLLVRVSLLRALCLRKIGAVAITIRGLVG